MYAVFSADQRGLLRQRTRETLDHDAFGWSHPKAGNVIRCGEESGIGRDKPDSAFWHRAQVPSLNH
jgi:hypothetical protein